LGTLGVALAGSISLTLKNIVFLPVYVKYILGVKIGKTYLEMIRPFICAVPLGCAALFLHKQFFLQGWLRIITASGCCCTIYFLAAYFVSFAKDDRAYVRRVFIDVWSGRLRSKIFTGASKP
jgi:membrane protein EpsK